MDFTRKRTEMCHLGSEKIRILYLLTRITSLGSISSLHLMIHRPQHRRNQTRGQGIIRRILRLAHHLWWGLYSNGQGPLVLGVLWITSLLNQGERISLLNKGERCFLDKGERRSVIRMGRTNLHVLVQNECRRQQVSRRIILRGGRSMKDGPMKTFADPI
jgi:hypothetical protein